VLERAFLVKKNHHPCTRAEALVLKIGSCSL